MACCASGGHDGPTLLAGITRRVGSSILASWDAANNVPSDEVSLRDYYILSYADYLCADPAVWRITIDYMYSCNNEIGKERADRILARVPFQPRQSSADAANAVRSGEVIGVLKDINEACRKYQRENVRRTVCKASSGVYLLKDHKTDRPARLPLVHSYKKRISVWQRLTAPLQRTGLVSVISLASSLRSMWRVCR